MTPVDIRPLRPADAVELAELRAHNAVTDDVDPYSTMESLPTAGDLEAAAETAIIFRVAAVDDSPVGYGAVRAWTELGETQVFLIDGYVAPELRGSGIATRLLQIGEYAAFDTVPVEHGVDKSVLAANASSAHPDQIELLENHQYQHVFSMIEMELRDLAIGQHPLPHALGIRDAAVNDARALFELTEKAWAGRPYYSGPTADEYQAWLARSDLSLFQIATIGNRIVGFVATIDAPHRAEVDDVLVDPDFRRQGIARSLLTANISLLRKRGVDRIRLHTEAHDPAGARSLYETLGFFVVREYRRYRKPLGSAKPRAQASSG